MPVETASNTETKIRVWSTWTARYKASKPKNNPA